MVALQFTIKIVFILQGFVLQSGLDFSRSSFRPFQSEDWQKKSYRLKIAFFGVILFKIAAARFIFVKFKKI